MATPTSGNARVQILLATWNGERYLPSLLQSLLAQTFRDWQLLVRDDGSTDGSLRILEATLGDRFVLARDDLGRLGARGNFARLLDLADSDFVFLADQDDVWLPDKLAGLLAVLGEPGDVQARVAICDCTLIDGEDAPIADSLWRFQRLPPADFTDPLEYCFANPSPGCAMALNRAALELARPVPATAIMHDWWMLLVAAFCGQIAVVDRPLVAYRLHSGNVIGSQRWNGYRVLGRLLGEPALLQRRLREQIAQLAILLDRPKLPLTAAARVQLQALVSLDRMPRLDRGLAALAAGLRRRRRLKTLLLYTSLLMLPRRSVAQ